MRLVIALAALLLAGLAIYQGNASRGQISYIEQTLQDAEIMEVEEEPVDEWWMPTWVPRTFICTWYEGQQKAARCSWAPRTVYRSQEMCDYTEWAAVELLVAEAERRGLKLAARVNCVEEYDV